MIHKREPKTSLLNFRERHNPNVTTLLTLWGQAVSLIRHSPVNNALLFQALRCEFCAESELSVATSYGNVLRYMYVTCYSCDTLTYVGPSE